LQDLLMRDARHGPAGLDLACSLQINGARRHNTRSGTMKSKQIQSSHQLSEGELDKVTGGRKAGAGQKDFLKVTMKEVFISG
jgi:hypothetical protein